jgi:hypothetical protein
VCRSVAKRGSERSGVLPIAIPNWEIDDSAKGIGSGYKIVVVCNNAVAQPASGMGTARERYEHFAVGSAR